MKRKSNTNLSKFLSLILRHKPEAIGIVLNENGWASISEIIRLSNKSGLTKEVIKEIVEECNKQRYTISDDGLQIRANQGHSVKVDVELKEKEPPLFLYHGTAAFQDIMSSGSIKKMGRLHVHLSEEIETAKMVGSRHGECYVMTIRAKKMHDDGIKFYQSENGVWLTDIVDSKYIQV